MSKSAGNKQDYQQQIQQAIQQQQQGNFSEAKTIYETLLAQSPKDTNLLHLRAILAAQEKSFAEALDYIQRAIKIDNKSATFYNTLGNIYLHMNNLPKAKEALNKSLSLMPNAPSSYNNLGIIHYKENNFAEAISYYQRAIALKEDYADAYFNLGQAQLKMGQEDEAVKNLIEAIKWQPNHPQAHAMLGQLYLQKEQFDVAVEHFEKTLALDPYHAESHHQLAIALTQQNHYDEAIAHYETAILLQPGHAEALHNIASLHLIMQKIDKATQYYLRLLEVNPNFDAYYNLGVVYLYRDRYQEAIGYFKEALKLQPDNLATHINLATTYLKQGNRAEAIAHYKEALRLSPDNKEIPYLLAALTESTDLSSVPAEYVTHLFDQYAPYFDKHLSEHLNYTAPKAVYSAVMEIICEGEKLHILDLGCGTGLSGELFSKHKQLLIGVDLSSKMLEAAKNKNIYDKLIHEDILSYLKQCTEQFDLILAIDTFGYIGELAPTIEQCRRVLKSTGLLAFTIEKTTHYPYKLQSNARFAYDEKYMQELADRFNFKIALMQDAVLRTQQKQPVIGQIVILSL